MNSESKTIEFIENNKKSIQQIINNLSENLNTKNYKEALLQSFHKISYFIEDYFVREELLLKRIHYPEIKEQTAEHKAFIEKMKYFQSHFQNIDKEFSQEFFVFLKEWFESYILNMDQKILKFLKERELS